MTMTWPNLSCRQTKNVEKEKEAWVSWVCCFGTREEHFAPQHWWCFRITLYQSIAYMNSEIEIERERWRACTVHTHTHTYIYRLQMIAFRWYSNNNRSNSNNDNIFIYIYIITVIMLRIVIIYHCRSIYCLSKKMLSYCILYGYSCTVPQWDFSWHAGSKVSWHVLNDQTIYLSVSVSAWWIEAGGSVAGPVVVGESFPARGPRWSQMSISFFSWDLEHVTRCCFWSFLGAGFGLWIRSPHS